jgi:hypothetical protein
MAVGHLVSSSLAFGVSLVSPDDFRFETIAQEGSEIAADGGETDTGAGTETGGER